MFGLGAPEIILIVIVFGLLFGSKNLLNMARSAGRFGGEFKKGQIEVEEELKGLSKESSKDNEAGKAI